MLPLEKKKSTHEKNSSSSPPRGDLPPFRPFYPATLCVTYTEVVQILIKERRPPQWIIGYRISTPGVSFDKPREGVQEIYPKYTSSNAAHKHL